MKDIGKKIYYLTAVFIGIGCFMAFLFVVFNSSTSIVSVDNKPMSILVTITTLIVVIIFLLIGKKIYHSKFNLPLTIFIIIITMILGLPAIYAGTSIQQKIKEYNANHKVDEFVYSLNERIKENSIGPFELNFQKSNYNTIFDGSNINLIFTKINQETLAKEEIDNIISFIPSSDRPFRIIIDYGKQKTTNTREFRFEIRLNMNKGLNECIDIFNEKLCRDYFKVN